MMACVSATQAEVPPDCPYVVTVDGKAAPIEKAGAYQGAYYVRFDLTDSVRVRVGVKATASTAFALKPERFRTNLNRADRGIEFDVDCPGPRVITTTSGSKGLWPLIVFADPPAQAPGAQAKVFSVANYVKSDGVQTTDIQRALDECGAAGGGVVRFGPGTYRTGPLFVRDNTTVYLDPGSVILGSTNKADYIVDGKLNRHDSHGPTTTAHALINFTDCRNCVLAGRGAIDGSGHVVRNEMGVNMALVNVLDGENVELRDVLLVNSPSWTVHILASKRVTVDNLKIVNDWTVGNTDGINPDCSQEVTITNYFGYCGDDALAIKTTSASDKLQGSRNIRARDCVVMTRKTAFKIGTETHKDISDVLLERCEAIDTSRGIGLYMRDGATISDLTYRDVSLDLMEYPGEGSSGAPYTAAIEERAGVGKIDGVTFERVSAAAPYTSGLVGHKDSPVRNVTFKDCSVKLKYRTIKMRQAPVFDLRHCADVRFRNFAVDWDDAVESLWLGFLRQEECTDIAVEGLREYGGSE